MSKIVNGFLAALHFVELYSGLTGGIVMAGMMLLITAEIIGRRFFGFPIPGQYEAMEAAVVFLTYLGWAYAQWQGKHVDVDAITTYWKSDKAAMAMSIFRTAVGFGTLAFLAYATFFKARLAWQEWDVTMGAVRFPLAPVKTAITFGCGLLALRYLIDLIAVVAKARKGVVTWTR